MYAPSVYVAEAGQTQFDIAFPFAAKTEVRVTVDTVPTDFTWVSNTRIQVTPRTLGEIVRLYRVTAVDAPSVTFADSILSSGDLNRAVRQLLQHAQEGIVEASTLNGVALQAVEARDAAVAATSGKLDRGGGNATSTILASLPYLSEGTGAVSRSLQSKLAETVSVEDFGAVGNGIADDTLAFNRAIAALLAKFGGGTVRYHGRHRLNALTVPRNITLQGPTGRADPGNPFISRVGFFAAMQVVPALILSPSTWITHEGSGGFDRVYFMRQGLALDGTDLATAYNGTAVKTGDTDAVFFNNCSFLGFNRPHESQGTARVIWDSVLVDCQNGPRQENSYDENTYCEVHCYGVLQAGVSNHDARTLRTGTAFYLGGVFNGGPTLFSCFEYGFAVGFEYVSPGSYKTIGCWSDGPTSAVTGKSLNPTSVGIRCVSADPSHVVAEPQFIGTTVSAKHIGVQLGADLYGATMLATVHIFGCDIGIECAASNVILSTFAIRSYFEVGIKFLSKAAADTAKLIGGSFYDAQVSASVEIDCGGGCPIQFGVTYEGPGIVRMSNTVAPTAVRGGDEVVVIPDAWDQFEVVATTPNPAGAIGDFYLRVPGRVITVTFGSAGFSLAGPNFVLASAFSGGVGSSITLRCNAVGKWVEQGRTVF